MKSKEYWNRRSLVDKAEIINNIEKFLQEETEKLFTIAKKEIEQQIQAIYQRYGDKNGLSLADAKRVINQADFKKIDWDELIRYHIDQQAEYKKNKDSLSEDVLAAIERQHTEYEQMLKSYTKHGEISRLELLQVQMDKVLIDVYDQNQSAIYGQLSHVYEDSYYRHIFNHQQGLGFGIDFVKINKKAIDIAITNQYVKDKFSETLYKHCNTFSADLRECLSVGMIRGEGVDKIASRIKKRMDVAHSSARRLVRTETAYIYEQAASKAYEECGVDRYRYLATLDLRTSTFCQKLDDKKFKVADAMPGKNYPPMHPNCRSTTVACFDDQVATTRIAKGDKGYYQVPSDMTYKQWHKKYIG